MSNFNKDEFEIVWEGLDDFIDDLGNMEAEYEKIIMSEMTKFGIHVEGATRKLVHHDYGDLEDSINFGPAKKTGAFVYTVEGGSSMPYALRRHEEPYRMGVHDKLPGDNFYVGGRGRGTHGKPSYRGFKPGRKYLTNAITAVTPDYNEMNNRIIERIMGLKS